MNNSASRQIQRNMIIGLTQTEIMFIFTCLIILLLLASLDRLSEIETERDEIVAILDEPEQAEPKELTQHVTALVEENQRLKVLIAEPTLADQHAALAQAVGSEPDTPLPQLMSEATNKLQQQGGNPQNSSKLSDSNNNQTTTTEAAEPNSTLTDLFERIRGTDTPEQPLAEQTDDVKSLRQQIAQLQQQNSELANQVTKTETIVREQRTKLIGFLPCWPQGETGHHFAYQIDYRISDNNFRLEPIWPSSVAFVQQDVANPLRVLAAYPQGWMNAETFTNFGRRLEQARLARYNNNCRLSARLINLDADGNVIKFIRDTVGLYPILR